MPNKTISLSDALCAQLERYAAEHNLAVSQVAQQALEQFLAASSPQPQQPVPVPSPAPEPAAKAPPAQPDQLPQVRDYLTELACYVDNLRDYLAAHAAIFDQPPPPFSPPPWWNSRPG